MKLTDLQKLLRPLHVRLSNLVSRGVVTRVTDSGKLQTLQLGLLSEETRDAVERFQQYGFTSVPIAGAEAVVLFVGGRRDHGLVVAVDDKRHRKSGLQAGEVAVYSQAGASVVLKADGSVEVTPKPGATVTLAGSADAVAKGSALNTAITNLGTAIASALTAMGASPATPMPGALAVTAGSSVAAAVTAFNSAAAAALSQQVKLS
jgi:phage baseplate assembly protein V